MFAQSSKFWSAETPSQNISGAEFGSYGSYRIPKCNCSKSCLMLFNLIQFYKISTAPYLPGIGLIS